jgi:hypothetical protein
MIVDLVERGEISKLGLAWLIWLMALEPAATAG